MELQEDEKMNDFKCPCTDHSCELNPVNHDKGCDLCVADSVETREIMKCMFKAAGGDIDKIDDWSFENFAKIVMENQR